MACNSLQNDLIVVLQYRAWNQHSLTQQSLHDTYGGKKVETAPDSGETRLQSTQSTNPAFNSTSAFSPPNTRMTTHRQPVGRVADRRPGTTNTPATTKSSWYLTCQNGKFGPQPIIPSQHLSMMCSANLYIDSNTSPASAKAMFS